MIPDPATPSAENALDSCEIVVQTDHPLPTSSSTSALLSHLIPLMVSHLDRKLNPVVDTLDSSLHPQASSAFEQSILWVESPSAFGLVLFDCESQAEISSSQKHSRVHQ